MNRKKLIFVTNDDGYASSGFAAAIDVAREMGDVIAVAPRTPQSGRSQAITLTEELMLEKVHDSDGVEIYTLTGTPTDCVKVAFDHMLGNRRVDMVISGINHGSNSAINVLYSGTMGAAIEGSFYGIPSIGLSLTDHSPNADFTAAKHYARRIIRAVFDEAITPGLPFCLNVNVPDLQQEHIRGIRFCRQCRGIWREQFSPTVYPDGRISFTMSGAYTNYEPDAEDTDEWALANGYVSVVPIQVDMTSYAHRPDIERILNRCRDTRPAAHTIQHCLTHNDTSL